MADYTTINDAGSFYNTVLYTGTGSSLGVTGAGFQPDFTWIKNRDAADFHVLTDAVRGATKYVQSNSDAAAVTDTETLKTFDSDGFTVGTTVQVNTNTEDYVSWNWKAGTTTGIAGSPSITPTAYSFNATSGCSVIAYTGNGTSGATLPHGLGAVPQSIFIKNLDAVQDWSCYHEYFGNTQYWEINQTTPKATATDRWNDTTPSSTLFTLGDSVTVNANTVKYIAYVFAPIQGYSNFGVYTGNGNTNGTFVYTGFRPAWILLKRGDTTLAASMMFDSKRPGYNEDNSRLLPNDLDGEDSGTHTLDILSNGFKLSTGSYITDQNGSGIPYIYIAFAEAPFVNSSGVPGTAR